MTTAIAKITEQNPANVSGVFSDNLLERFAKFAGVSENSKRTYIKCLRQMFRHFQANAITMPTRENLVDWIAEMKNAGRAASTITLYTTAAKIFFRWLAQENIYPNVADNLKTGVKPSRGHKKDALTVEQCADLVKGVKTCKVVKGVEVDDVKGLRDKAILSLMTTAGLRCVEVVRANIADVRFDRGKTFLYVTGKGHSEADERVLLSRQTYKAIQVYLKARGKAAATEPLFTSTSRRNNGERLQTQTISRLVKKNLRAMDLDSPRLTAHSLRHSTATNLVFAGVDLPKIQMTLRHKNLATTMIYLNAYERFHNDAEQILADQIFKE